MSTVAVHSGAVTQQYDALVSRLKRVRREGRAPALAIVSSSSGAGVSSVAKALTDRMNAGAKARRAEDVTISISAEAFIHPPASVGGS